MWRRRGRDWLRPFVGRPWSSSLLLPDSCERVSIKLRLGGQHDEPSGGPFFFFGALFPRCLSLFGESAGCSSRRVRLVPLLLDLVQPSLLGLLPGRKHRAKCALQAFDRRRLPRVVGDHRRSLQALSQDLGAHPDALRIEGRGEDLALGLLRVSNRLHDAFTEIVPSPNRVVAFEERSCWHGCREIRLGRLFWTSV